jgi:hypothetical protein
LNWWALDKIEPYTKCSPTIRNTSPQDGVEGIVKHHFRLP